jgi:hypothetical protein
MRIPGLDLLRCFVAIAERGGLTATGAALGLREVADPPSLGTAEMCVFGDAEGRSALVEPLVGLIRESLASAHRAAA